MLEKYVASFRRSVSIGGRALGLARREPQAVLFVGRMAWCVVVLSIGVKVLPLPSALRLIAPRQLKTPPPRDPQLTDARAVQLLDALLGTDFLVFTPSCWKRSAALYSHLAARETNARIRFGVCKESDGSLAGHAWIEIDGTPVFEKTAPDYRVTFSFPN